MIASNTPFDSKGGFSGSSYPKKIVEIECLTVVAMATNLGTKIAITGFVRMIATRQLVMEGFDWLADRKPILLIPCTLNITKFLPQNGLNVGHADL